jgi:hypothetical protein
MSRLQRGCTTPFEQVACLRTSSRLVSSRRTNLFLESHAIPATQPTDAHCASPDAARPTLDADESLPNGRVVDASGRVHIPPIDFVHPVPPTAELDALPKRAKLPRVADTSLCAHPPPQLAQPRDRAHEPAGQPREWEWEWKWKRERAGFGGVHRSPSHADSQPSSTRVHGHLPHLQLVQLPLARSRWGQRQRRRGDALAHVVQFAEGGLGDGHPVRGAPDLAPRRGGGRGGWHGPRPGTVERTADWDYRWRGGHCARLAPSQDTAEDYEQRHRTAADCDSRPQARVPGSHLPFPSTPTDEPPAQLKPSRLLMLQSELTYPPTDTETQSEAAFQRLLSTSSDLAQTLGLAIPGTGRARTRKKSGLGNRYPESVGGGESDRDVGGGVGGTKADEDTTSSEEGDGAGDDTFVLQKEATWDMELQVGSAGLERGLTMELINGGSVMDVDMNDRVRPPLSLFSRAAHAGPSQSALSSPRSSISMPFQWRERSNPAYTRPGKRKFSDAQLLDLHATGSGPLSKRRRGGSPALPPRSPIVQIQMQGHGRNHSHPHANPWQARMPSSLARDKDREREREREREDAMDGTMSARSSPLLRPTSSHGHGALGLNGLSLGGSLLGLHQAGGNANGTGGGNGAGGGGAGVGIPIHVPPPSIGMGLGMGTSPGSAMGMYVAASGLGAGVGVGVGGSPSLRPMHRLPRRAGAGGQQHHHHGKGVQEGVGGLRIRESG